MTFGGLFDIASKASELAHLEKDMASETLWSDQEKMQQLGKRKAALEHILQPMQALKQMLDDLPEWFVMLKEDLDPSALADLEKELSRAEKEVEGLTFKQRFAHPQDPSGAYLEIQAGSGGTEAQDWAEMLLRMYVRWGEDHDMQGKVIELSQGEVAGIKSATIHYATPYAYGWLRSETGVHRLVRKSPFDSSNRRHTSFASVFISPEIDEDIEVDLNLSDCRIDTYRSSGAGGQHVNTTDSAVRITHLPTQTVVQCQAERSQHKNKAKAIKQLKAKLYQLALAEQMSTKQLLASDKKAISWGSQIRSYVLDSGRIKDLRTQVETGNTQAVLDGGIDLFLEASLMAGVGLPESKDNTASEDNKET
jgi:peptide chain release factor 2